MSVSDPVEKRDQDMKAGLERAAKFTKLFDHVGVLLRYHDRGFNDDDYGEDNSPQCDNQ